jgi:hypothetical protein
MSNLETAIRRLREFCQSWDATDEIDEQSKLTAGDLDVVLAELSPGKPVAAGQGEVGFATNGE